MTNDQKAIFAEIQEMKRTPGHDKKVLARLVRQLVRDDDREWELRHRRNDPGGRSRSPSFGKWYRDDESFR